MCLTVTEGVWTGLVYRPVVCEPEEALISVVWLVLYSRLPRPVLTASPSATLFPLPTRSGS